MSQTGPSRPKGERRRFFDTPERDRARCRPVLGLCTGLIEVAKRRFLTKLSGYESKRDSLSYRSGGSGFADRRIAQGIPTGTKDETIRTEISTQRKEDT
mgnify:CR=1 FL=1